MSTTADSFQDAAPGLVAMSEDEVMLAFLRSSAADLPPAERQLFDGIDDTGSFEGKLVCRKVCRSMGRLQHFKARKWYRVLLTSRQLGFIRLGQESGNSFSRYFSKGTYRPDIAARTMEGSAELDSKRSMHRDKVVQMAETIDVDGLRDVILCASNYTINRQLKALDGNHRLTAFVLKHGQLTPFSCIVGFTKPLYFGLVQRALLAFPFYSELRNATGFAVRQNMRRGRGLLFGGMNYQPLLANREELLRLSQSGDDEIHESSNEDMRSERRCADRARMLRDDMRSNIGELAGSSLLDVGCNVGFFCHFFAALGMRTVGVDNSQHNRRQKFSFSNSIRIARRMNRRYGLASEFIDDDARAWAGKRTGEFDVVLLLSVLHHFFVGYPVGGYSEDPMEEAMRFLKDVAMLTRKVLYIEYEDEQSSVSTAELMEYLLAFGLFRDVSIVSYSDDFARPVIRCMKHAD